MSKKDSYQLATNIYWDHAPSQKDQLKDVLAPGVYQNPGKVINSSRVKVEAKPWLRRNCKKPSKTIENVHNHVNSSRPQSDLKMEGKQSKKENVIGNTIQQASITGIATLRDLRKEDKQKVAKLIRELAKFGEEKENALDQLNHVTVDFESKLRHLEEDKQRATREQDLLKERILEYEILLQEMKKSKQIEYSIKKVENFPSPEDLPGNSKIVKKYDIKQYKDLRSFEKFTKHSNTLDIGENKTYLNETDKFADVFMEQQATFQNQQEILQEQIEQLHRLQESLLQQQMMRHITSPVHSNELGKIYRDDTQLNITQNGDGIGENSRKLQSYILQENSTSILHDGNRSNVSSPIKRHAHILATDTKSIDSIETLAHTSTTESENKNLSVRSSVNKKQPNDGNVPNCKDVCIQTDENNLKKLESDRLEQCEKNISILEQSLRYVSSKSPVMKTSGNSSTKKIMISHSDLPPYIPIHENKKTEVGSKQAVNNKHASKYKQSNSNKLITSLIEDSSGESDCTLADDSSPLPQKNLSSPVRRRHFQPSSVLELVGGLQPRSASTSVDQYSLQRASGMSIKSFKHHGKDHKNSKKKSRLERIYGRGCKRKKRMAHKSDEEATEEQDVLEDVFFVN